MEHVKLVIFTLILITTGCSTPTIEYDQGHNAFVDDLLGKKLPTIEHSRVVYHKRLDPAMLTDEQLGGISDYLCLTDFDIKDVWFVNVIYNNNSILKTVVYFLPEANDKRIWNGKYIHYGSYQRSRRSKLTREQVKPHYYEYIQVAAKEKISGGQVGIPTQANLYPFPTPQGFTEDEIVGIVDFIRSDPNEIMIAPRKSIMHEDPKKEKITAFKDSVEAYITVTTMISMQPIERDLPIKDISRNGDIIEVETGVQEGPLAGYGQVLEIRKTDVGYELISVGMWVS